MSAKTAAQLAYTTTTAAEATGLSQSALVEAIRRGDLKARKSGRREDGEPVGKFIILAADLQAFLAGLPQA